MATICKKVALVLFLLGFHGCLAVPKGQFQKEDSPEILKALEIARLADEKTGKPSAEAQAEADAKNAHRAAKMAKEAAKVAATVADHSIQMTEHAKGALKDAHNALHDARVSSSGLSQDQRQSLKEAEKKLREATKEAEFGKVKDAKYDKKLKKLEDKMKATKKGDSSELDEMRKELEELRKRLEKRGDASDDKAIKELQKKLKEMEKAEKKEDKADSKSHDEMKAEIERLREQIERLEKQDHKEKPKRKPSGDSSHAARVESKDIDMDMPYGDLEPFGREDTAQELTENSIHESDEMVDQLERAEVAEEKRAVFRALTRLRGAAITSFDGVARSQTGNIDEYNQIHQWRKTHPVRHLADEESDVAKWAFPDNADLLQMEDYE